MIGETIRIERLKKGWSQENMAHMLNISQAAYSKIESGQTKMKLTTLYEIAKILEVEVEVLTKGWKMSMGTDLSLVEKWIINLKLWLRKASLKKDLTSESPIK
ncbi:helix-turn-helix domain-containing protein [Pedobacter alpinus]|uniref:Helix-turn-helix domain-containing protein n=1 Tax=Pedobacter alpinus TaxID=1590643 RepID=A0ABW5TMP5_9SPHI